MLSIIIPTLNEEENLKNLLPVLAKQVKESDEIIIVDGQSTDGTRMIARKYGAKIVDEPKKGMGYARTLGARNAKNEIVVFVDADCRVPNDFVDMIKSHFDEKGNDNVALAGLGIYSSDSTLRREIYNLLARGVFAFAAANYKITKKYWLPANNCAIRKEVFLSVGGYRSVVCEETDLMRLLPPSEKVHYDEKIRVTLSDRRFRRYGFIKTLGIWGWNNILVMFGKGTDPSKGYSNIWTKKE